MDTMTTEALEAKKSPEALNSFIASNKNFVIFSANQALNRYITDSDDEYSIALIAFSEAVESFDESKGSFSSFASLVIKRRLVDHIRRESRFSNETSVEPAVIDGEITDEDNVSSMEYAVRSKTAALSEATSVHDNPVADEIEAVRQLLDRYDIDFFDLEKSSPVSMKTKRECGKAVRCLLADEELLSTMRKKKSLPMKELSDKSGVKTKLLERHRRYIIAAAEILNGEYPLLAEYMSYIKKDIKL